MWFGCSRTANDNANFFALRKGVFALLARRQLYLAVVHEAKPLLHVSTVSLQIFSVIVQLFQCRDGKLESKMKREFKKIMMTMLLVTASAAPALAAENYVKEGVNGTANITVTLTGVKDVTGNIQAGLYNSANGYNKGGTVRGARVDVVADTVIITYSDLPDGDYAIKLFHDVDGDGKMNANLFGMPTEPFAFSNNAVGKMGPAKWKDAKFTVSGSETAHAMKLN